MLEVLTPAQMAAADRAAIEVGPWSGLDLMNRAGQAVFTEVIAGWPEAREHAVLCGPGNNGGDGYVVARLLREAGLSVSLFADTSPRSRSDAEKAAAECPVERRPLGNFVPRPGMLVVDALFGAGLARPLEGTPARIAVACREAGVPTIAVDLPSGVSGNDGRIGSDAFRADLTVTFQRLKPAHLLQPGRGHCGQIVLADIGISDASIARALNAQSPLTLNRPKLWRGRIGAPAVDAHKYARGHAAVFSGGPGATGAARLAAMAAARIGAGAVTVLSPGSAMAVNASHLTSIMLRRVDTADDLRALADGRRLDAAVIGPGFGNDELLRRHVEALLEGKLVRGLVLDADAFGALGSVAGRLAEWTRDTETVMTPHHGEFGRMFADIAAEAGLSKVEQARLAATRCGCTVVYKGPDTVIAAPDGSAAICDNATSWLATAGSGDVLAGMVAGLLAQGLPAFEAACAAAWMHGEAGTRLGPGLIAEDLPGAIPAILRELLD